jgi:peptide deformylase
MEIVPLEEIPQPEYKTPFQNLTELYVTAQRMESLCRSLDGLGLSASQVGIPWNFFIYWANYPEEPSKFEYLADCEYLGVGEKSDSVEGCLSLKGMHFRLGRYGKVVVKGKRLVCDEDALRLEEFEREFSGIPAVILQHEIDHNFGRERMIDTIGRRIFLSC